MLDQFSHRCLTYIIILASKLTLEMGENYKNEQKRLLTSYLRSPLKILMSDNRVMVGIFVCTDADQNIILMGCQEYHYSTKNDSNDNQNGKEEQQFDEINLHEPNRTLGIVMVPGNHIKKIWIGRPAPRLEVKTSREKVNDLAD
uniref:Sm domain-containing protein n=1 Tax=Romanomermis culicivorax TaxID=13658 RepID=A0A915HYQ3_ROMCU